MLKFVVVLYKRPDRSPAEFRSYFRDIHGPMVQKLPGLRKYIQNYVAADPKRKHPGWDGVAELYFDGWEALESAWASPEGKAATDDLAEFLDLERTTWSVVDEAIIAA